LIRLFITIASLSQGANEMHILQFQGSKKSKQVGLVANHKIFPINTNKLFCALVIDSIELGIPFEKYLKQYDLFDPIDFSSFFKANRLLPLLNGFPLEKILISGTGLTHKNSAILRTSMYANDEATDAQKIYQSGLLVGKPTIPALGAIPEWFFKGFGSQLKTTEDHLGINAYNFFVGEEAELAVIYYIDGNCIPNSLGFCLGNELSDHGLEKKNHYYLAQSKLLECAIGPEIFIGELPEFICGNVSIVSPSEVKWQANLRTGQSRMNHSLANLEYHIFKHSVICQPKTMHVFYLGADVVSYVDNVKIDSGDEIIINMDLFNFELRNIIQMKQAENLFQIKLLETEAS